MIPIPLLLQREKDSELFDHDDCLNPPVSNSYAMLALIFLLFDPISKRFLSADMEDLDGPRNMKQN